MYQLAMSCSTRWMKLAEKVLQSFIQADLLSIQLLHDSNKDMEDNNFAGEVGRCSFDIARVHNSTNIHFQGCWHGRPTGRVIFTQNITFNKYPGQNIRGTCGGQSRDIISSS